MRKASVFRLSMAHPGDLSELARLITNGTVAASDVVAIIGKTEGNGGVNDFTRGYFTQTLMGLLSKHLGKPPDQLVREIPCVLSGGTEGVMSPHYHVFCIGDVDASTEQYASALSIGTAFSPPTAAEDVGRRANVESVAAAVREAIAHAGIERLEDVHFVQVKCPCVTVARASAAIAADGRYSRTRRVMSGEPRTRLTGVAVFRVLVGDTSGGLIDDYEQWFNGPNRLLAFRVPPDHVYIAGTFPILPEADIAEDLRAPEALRKAYTPPAAPPSEEARWLIDTVCNNAAETHWARMQEHDLLYRADDCNVLYLGDAAHGMVPTLGQGATQAIEDAANAAALITRHHHDGVDDVGRWLADIEALRKDRMRFVMEFSRDATDTMLAGADPVEGTRRKTEAAFRNRLKTLYRDVGLP